MSDSNLNQNTSEDTSFPAAAPETNASAPAPQSAGPEEEPKQKTFTRRTVLAMAGCGVAGRVVGGVLATYYLAFFLSVGGVKGVFTFMAVAFAIAIIALWIWGQETARRSVEDTSAAPQK